MKNITLDAKKSDNITQERQADTATCQGKMNNGRFVATKESDTQTFSQMTASSSTFQRAIIDKTVVAEDTQETISSQELIPEKRMTKSTPSHFFKNAVSKIIAEVSTESLAKYKDFPQCLLLVKKIDELRKQFNIKLQCNYDFIIYKIGPFYQEHLKFALEFLQNKADTECSWEYNRDLNNLARYFDFQPKNSPTRPANCNKFSQLFEKFAFNEINYIESLEDYPWPHSARRSIKHSHYLLNTLLLNTSPYFHPDIINIADISALIIRKEKLLKNVFYPICQACYTCPITRTQKKEEEFYILEKNNLSSTTCMKTKRNYNNILHYKLSILSKANNIRFMTMHQNVHFLQQLINLYKKYTDCISENEFYTLGRDIKTLMSSLSITLLLEIKDTHSDMNPLKKQALDLIFSLDQRNLLSYMCKNICIAYTEQTAAKHPTKADKFTDTHCNKYINKIFTLISTKVYDYKAGALLLKNLLDEREHTIKNLCTSDSLFKKIHIIKGVLYSHFFMEIFMTYNHCQNNNTPYIKQCIIMNKFKRTLIEVSPYTFILESDELKDTWRKIACLTFFTNIDKLSTKESFCKDDIDSLRFLLDIAPEVPDRCTRNRLEDSLIQCFRFFLENDTTAIPTETIASLSNWIDTLNNMPASIRPELKTLNQQWKTKIYVQAHSLSESKDKPITSGCSNEQEQYASAETECGVIATQEPQSDSFCQVVELPSCNLEHTPQQTITDMNPTSSSFPHRDQQVIYQRMPHVPVFSPSPPLMTLQYVATTQPSMPTVQPLQVPHHVAFISQSIDGRHCFSMLPSMHYPRPSLLQSFRQPAPPPPPPELVQPRQYHCLIPPTQYRPEMSLNSDIQQTLTRPSVEPIEHNPLQSMEYGTTQMPTQNKRHQLNPNAPAYYPTKK